MADYRAMNRKAKGLDAERIRLAGMISSATFGHTGAAGMLMRAPKVNPGLVPQLPKDPVAYSAALRKYAQRGVRGAHPLTTSDPNKLGTESWFDPAKGFFASLGLVNHNYNPEGIKYGQGGRVVPTGRGPITSAYGPGRGGSFGGVGAALYGAAEGAPTTQFDADMQEKNKNNPRVVQATLAQLSPEQKSERKNQQMIVDRAEDYSDFIRTINAAGLTEEDLLRDIVVSPDGMVNFNPNAKAIIDGLGLAADSLRLLDVAGLGLGKPIAVGASIASKVALSTMSRAAKVATKSVIPRARQAAEDVVMAPAGVLLSVGGGGGNILRAARDAAAARKKANEENLPFEDQFLPGDEAALQAKRRPIAPGSPEARIIEEAENATPLNVDTLSPPRNADGDYIKNANGDYDSVEINAQDEASGQSTFDPSEVRLLTLGGAGRYGKFGPLARLSDLAIPKKATKIRAIYAVPDASEILRLMRRTDDAVEGRPNVASWTKNKYTIEDAQVLRDRWITAADAFEKANGRPLPWRLEADVPNPEKGGKIEVKRIFGQDVEHAIPVNKGGKGTVDELVLLPSIGNSGKRDFAWEDYASNNPYNWNAYLESFYGDIKRF